MKFFFGVVLFFVTVTCVPLLGSAFSPHPPVLNTLSKSLDRPVVIICGSPGDDIGAVAENSVGRKEKEKEAEEDCQEESIDPFADRTLFFGKPKNANAAEKDLRDSNGNESTTKKNSESKNIIAVEASDETEDRPIPTNLTAATTTATESIEIEESHFDPVPHNSTTTTATTDSTEEKSYYAARKSNPSEVERLKTLPQPQSQERGTTINLAEAVRGTTISLAEAIKSVPVMIEKEVDKTVTSVEEEIETVKSRVELKVDEVEREVERTRKNIEEKVEEVKAIPGRVQQSIDDTKAEVERKRQEVVQTVDDIKAIPGRVKRSYVETKTKVDDTVETIDQTAKEIQAVPGKLKDGYFEAKDKFYETVDEIQSIPGKVEKTVIDTKEKVDNTVSTIKAIPDNVKKGVDVMKDTANNIIDFAAGLTGARKKKKIKPQLRPPPPLDKTNGNIESSASIDNEDIDSILALAQEAIKGADEVLQEGKKN